MTQGRFFPEEAPAPVYAIDTCSVIWLDGINREPDDSYRYSQQEMTAIWAGLEAFAKQGCLKIIPAVRRELKDNHPLGLKRLLRQGSCRAPNKTRAVRLAVKPYAAAMVKPYWSRDPADPWLLAYAEVHGYIVVSDELRRGLSRIPVICQTAGIPCFTLRRLAEEQSWI